MRLIRYEYILVLIGIFALIFFSLSFFFISKEWSFARSYGSLVKSTDWFGYYSELQLRKVYSKIIPNNKIGLPTKHFYISESNLDKLLSKIPDTTKEWQEGFIFENGKMKKIQVRYLGDNLNNWIFENRSFKLKYSKKNFENNYRSYDYFTTRLNSENNLNFTRLISHFLLEKFGNPVPKIQMVEIRINGENQGIFLQIPRLDEMFLRKNNLMPVNIYKGENNNREFKIGIDENLFNNPFLWSKVSVFNQTEISDKKDLEFFLKLLTDFQNNLISPSFFFSKIPADKWAKFLISGASDHGADFQNQRMIADPWTGEYLPLPVDSVFDLNNLINHNIERNFYNFRDRVLNSDPYFVLQKYKIYYNEIIKKKVLYEFTNYLYQIKPKLVNSAKRDYHFIRNFYEGKIEREKLNLFENNKTLAKQIDKLILDLNSVSEKKSYFSNNVNTNWFYEDSNLFFTLKDKIPSGNILIEFSADEKPNLDDISILLKNTNKFHKEQIIPFEIIGENKILLKLVLVADRIFYLENNFKGTKSKIKPTLFKFQFNKNLKIKDVYVQNIFTNNFNKVEYSKNYGLKKSKNNYAIISQKDEITELSGDNYFNQTKIFNNKVIIKPGTNFFLKKNVSLVFKNQLIAEATKNEPIIISQFSKDNHWGSILLVGKKTSNSKLKNVYLEGGSGGVIENIRSIGMFSIHNSENIDLQNIYISNNSNYDDTMHIIYSKDIKINNLNMTDIFSDGIDIDMSENIVINDANINSAKNDCLDFMQTTATINNSIFQNCSDKGVSIGENSNISIYSSNFLNNEIAIESKDKSFAEIKDSKFILNKLVFSAYKKNWRYNGGGKIRSVNNTIQDNIKFKKIDKFSFLEEK